MGNMLESDSSGNSDTEVEAPNKDKHKERTAGDGMECDISLPSVVDASSPLMTLTSTTLQNNRRRDSIDKLNSEMTSVSSNEHSVHDKNDIETRLGSNSLSIANKRGSEALLSTTSTIAAKSTSPRQLPARNLLIPVKPPRLESNNSACSSGKTPRLIPIDKANVKQKNPKFVPYEPYSAAIRPFVPFHGHARKPSDTSSVVSQSSTISTSESHADAGTDHVKDESKTGYTNLASHQIQSPNNKNGPIKNKGASTHYNQDHHGHHPSTTLMKERLKMAEKEICDLQSENARLKKLFVDSMAGAPCPISAGEGVADSINNLNSVTQQKANNLQHRNKERVDNLNDELEVSRSKFLSSCVLVDQLTKDNQDLSGTINEAAEIIKDLKNTASLTQEQYENINEWLRKTKHSSYSSLPDNNFCQDYLDSTTS